MAAASAAVRRRRISQQATSLRETSGEEEKELEEFSFRKTPEQLYIVYLRKGAAMKKKFKCEIDCANCAAKVEEAIKKLPGVNDAKVNFMLQKFTLDAEDEQFDAILKEAVAVGRKIEPDFSVEI